MRSVYIAICLFLMSLPCLAQGENRYGLAELGLSAAQSNLAGGTTNLANSPIVSFNNLSLNLHGKWGIELDDGSPSLPFGLQISTENGVSLDVGTPQFWMLSAFMDVQTPEPSVDKLERPGVALTTGARGQYALDLYRFGGEIGYTTPVNFFASNKIYSGQGYQDAGFIYKLWAKAIAPVTSKLTFSTQVQFVFGDHNYNSLYFGLSETQSRQSGLTAYQPNAGFIYGKGSFEVQYLFDNDWLLQGRAELVRFSGEAAASPLIKERGEWAGSLGLTAIYRF